MPRIVYHLPLVIDDHRRALIRIVGWPLRRQRCIWNSRPRKRRPRPADSIGQRLQIGTVSDFIWLLLRIIKHKRQLDRMWRMPPAAFARCLPRKEIHISWRFPLRELAFGLLDRIARKGERLKKDFARARIGRFLAVRLNQLFGCVPIPLRQLRLQSGFVQRIERRELRILRWHEKRAFRVDRSDHHRYLGGNFGSCRVPRIARQVLTIYYGSQLKGPAARCSLTAGIDSGQEFLHRQFLQLIDLIRLQAQLTEKSLGGFAGIFPADAFQRRAALDDRPVYQAIRSRHAQQSAHLRAASRLPKQRHVARIAPKTRDVVTRPLQRRDHIEQSSVARICVFVTAQTSQIQIPEYVKPVVNTDHYHVAPARQIIAVKRMRRTRAPRIPPAMPPHHHRSLAAQRRRKYIQDEAVFALKRRSAVAQDQRIWGAAELRRGGAVLKCISHAGPWLGLSRSHESVGARCRCAVRNSAKGL